MHADSPPQNEPGAAERPADRILSPLADAVQGLPGRFVRRIGIDGVDGNLHGFARS